MDTTSQPFIPNPSEFLLKADPDLRPDQVWMVMTYDETSGLSQTTVIADNLAQIQDSAAMLKQDLLLAVNETSVAERIAQAESQPVCVLKDWAGRPGTERFGLIFRDAADMRMVWVAAKDARQAMKARRGLGEKDRPVGVVRLNDFLATAATLRKVRENRGNGASEDCRYPDHDLSRWRALEIERLPGGQAELDDQMKILDGIYERGCADLERKRAAEQTSK